MLPMRSVLRISTRTRSATTEQSVAGGVTVVVDLLEVVEIDECQRQLLARLLRIRMASTSSCMCERLGRPVAGRVGTRSARPGSPSAVRSAASVDDFPLSDWRAWRQTHGGSRENLRARAVRPIEAVAIAQQHQQAAPVRSAMAIQCRLDCDRPTSCRPATVLNRRRRAW